MKTKYFFLALLFISIFLFSNIDGNAQRRNKTIRKPAKTKKQINLSVEQSNFIRFVIKQAKSIDDGYIVYINSVDVDNLFGGAIEIFPHINTIELPKPFQDEVNFLIKIVSGWRELHKLLTWKRNTLNAIQYQTQLNELLDEYKMTGVSPARAFSIFRQIANNSRVKLNKMFLPYAESDL